MLVSRLGWISLALAALAGSAPLAAQSYKLNDALPRATLGAVSSFELSPDGARAVFLADLSATESELQLFSAAVDGSAAPVQLSRSPVLGHVNAPQITPDSSRVVFLSTLGTSLNWLYSVPIDGSHDPRPLNQGGSVSAFELAPGGRVVYRADRDTHDVFELYSKPADGSAPLIKLSGPMVAGGDVQAEFRISDDGKWVVYRADQDADDVVDLYGVPTDGSAPAVRLNLTRPNADVQGDFAIAADSLGVVYRADQDTDEVFELYAVGIDGVFPSRKLNAPLVAGGDVQSFVLSGVNDRLLYLADQDVNDVVELYSLHAISASTPVKLDATLVAGSTVLDMQLGANALRVVYHIRRANGTQALFGVPADGSSPAVELGAVAAGRGIAYQLPAGGGRVLYVDAAAFNPRAELFSVPLDGSQPPLRLSAALGVSSRGSTPQDVLADGGVLFTADQVATGRFELYHVPLDGSAGEVRLSAHIVGGGAVLSARATSDGSWVVYLARQDHVQAAELYSVPSAGGDVRRLSGPLPLGAAIGDVSSFELARDGSRAVYSAREDTTAFHDLYSVATDGSGHSVRLDLPLGGNEDLGEFEISPDGTRVVYGLVRDDIWHELYSTAIDSPHTSLRLDAQPRFTFGLFHGPYQFAFTPDSSRVVYIADQDSASVFELYVVPSDGSQPAARLLPPLGALENVDRFALSPDGAWIVYALSSLNVEQLMSFPLDGHQPPAQLNAPLVAGGSVSPHWEISPDSARVVYVADQDLDERFELYSAPIDGSLGPVKLNATLVADGDVGDVTHGLEPFRLSPDGARVVYRADQDVDESFELYSVPITGGTAAKLNGSLVAGGDAGLFEIDPGSTRVVYQADEEADDVHELYSVPLAGGARVKLNAPLPAGGEVHNLGHDDQPAFRISALGTVVYHAEQLADGRFELFSVPLDGSAAPVRVSDPLPAGGEVFDDFRLTVNGAGVVYAADGRTDQVTELFTVPLDGSHAARVVSGAMVMDGDVLVGSAFQLTTDGRCVVYLADQDTDGVPELFAGLLDFQRGPRRAATPSRMVVR